MYRALAMARRLAFCVAAILWVSHVMVISSLPHLRPDVSDEIIEYSAMQGGLPGWRGAIRL